MCCAALWFHLGQRRVVMCYVVLRCCVVMLRVMSCCAVLRCSTLHCFASSFVVASLNTKICT